MRCDLCGTDEALENGLLCLACSEAIERLRVIRDVERIRDIQAKAATADVEPSEERLNRRSAKLD